MNGNIYWLVLLFFSCTTFHSNAQVIKGALIGGINLTQVDGDEIYGFKRVGANVGAAAIIPFTDRWSITLETLYSMEGSNQKGVDGRWIQDSAAIKINPYNDSSWFYINGAYNLHLDYVRVPIIVHYNDRKLSLGAGFQYGRLVRVKEQEHDIYNTTPKAEEAYRKDDISILGDAKYRIYGGLFINFRYSYTLFRSIRSRTFYSINNPGVTLNRKQYHNTITLRLIWVINDKGKSLEQQNKEKNVF
jgi:hypothetical protein